MRDLVVLLDRLRADLGDASGALERGDLDEAIAALGRFDQRLAEKVDELRTAEAAA